MTDSLTVAEAARILREAVKDRKFEGTTLGPWVTRYIRWMRNEYGATPPTIRDYEAILARMCLTLDKPHIEVDIEDLRDVIDLWAGQTARTRQKVTSVIRSFWGWMEDEGHIAISPAARIRRPRVEKKVARTLPANARTSFLSAAKSPRDRLGLYCLLVLGVRQAELRGIQARDFDPDRGNLRVYGKGQKERDLPLRGPILDELRLYLSTDLPHVGRPPEPDDYLLYPVQPRLGGKGTEGQAKKVYEARPKNMPSAQSVHRWWYKLAQQAGFVSPGVTSGFNMHRARHTFAVELRRVAGIEAASQALGHAELNTTLAIYGHQDQADLERAMDKYAGWLEDQKIPPEES